LINQRCKRWAWHKNRPSVKGRMANWLCGLCFHITTRKTKACFQVTKDIQVVTL